MHILLIHQIFVTPAYGGGTRHYELAKYLVQMGHKVTVIASDIDYLSQQKKPTKETIIEGITIKYAKSYSGLHKTILSRALAFLSFSFSSFFLGLNIKNIDIIYGTSPPLFQSISTLLLAKLKRKPFVFETRDLWLDFAKELNIIKQPFLYHGFKKVEKFIYQQSDYLIVNSPGFIPFIKKIVPNKPVTLFSNGVIPEEFHAQQTPIVHLKKSKDQFIVLYTGNIGIANDIETILHTAQILQFEYPKIHFYIIGGGLNFTTFKEHCKSDKITNVSFIASVPKKDIPGIINQANVCLATLKNIPLFGTVYPNKVFDYMAAKKPTILAIKGVIQEVIDQSKGGQSIPPENVEAMTKSILFYYKNSDKCIEHGQNAYHYVKTNFDRKKIAKELESYFLSITKKNTHV